MDVLDGEVKTALPAGRYRVSATKGIEWSIDSEVIEIVSGHTRSIELAPRHVVPTPGLVGCDLHVHARPSFDSPVTPEDRVLSLVSAGVDFAVPAVAQGVLGIETKHRSDLDPGLLELVREAIHDEAEARRVAAERAFLLRMGGSCQTPLAAHAIDDGDGIKLLGLCGMPDGSNILRGEVRGPVVQAEALGIQLVDPHGGEETLLGFAGWAARALGLPLVG